MAIVTTAISTAALLKKSGVLGKIFGGSTPEAINIDRISNMCNPNDVRMETVYRAVLADVKLRNEISNFIADSLRREGGQALKDLPNSLKNMATPEGLALQLFFNAQGSRDCKVKGKSEKEIAAKLGDFVRKAENVLSQSTYPIRKSVNSTRPAATATIPRNNNFSSTPSVFNANFDSDLQALNFGLNVESGARSVLPFILAGVLVLIFAKS